MPHTAEAKAHTHTRAFAYSRVAPADRQTSARTLTQRRSYDRHRHASQTPWWWHSIWNNAFDSARVLEWENRLACRVVYMHGCCSRYSIFSTSFDWINACAASLCGFVSMGRATRCHRRRKRTHTRERTISMMVMCVRRIRSGERSQSWRAGHQVWFGELQSIIAHIHELWTIASAAATYGYVMVDSFLPSFYCCCRRRYCCCWLLLRTACCFALFICPKICVRLALHAHTDAHIAA